MAFINILLCLDKRFKELEMREKVLKYMYNPEVTGIKGLQRHSYYNEISRHDAGAKDFTDKWIEMKLGKPISHSVLNNHDMFRQK